LQRQFALDDEALADLKDELIEAERVAADENGKVLVWTGTDSAGETAKRGNGEKVPLLNPKSSILKAKAKRVSSKPSPSPKNRVPNRGNCAPPRVWRGCGNSKTSEPKPVIYSLQSTTGSLKGLTRQICKMRKLFLTNCHDQNSRPVFHENCQSSGLLTGPVEVRSDGIHRAVIIEKPSFGLYMNAR
jgi:hypothetical protein